MLPFNAQGAVSAMEDGGALGYLFQHVDDPELIPERLEIFQRARADRVARVQILSNVKLGKEKEVEEQVRQYADPRGSSTPSLQAFSNFFYSYKRQASRQIWLSMLLMIMGERCCTTGLPPRVLTICSYDVFAKCDILMAASLNSRIPA